MESGNERKSARSGAKGRIRALVGWGKLERKSTVTVGAT
jgi:hypothetical protein